MTSRPVVLALAAAVVLAAGGQFVLFQQIARVGEEVQQLRGALVASGRGKPAPGNQPLPANPVSLDGARRQGNDGAKVALIEFSDFECPFCSKFATTVLPEIQEKYVQPGKVLLTFRQLPLERLHKQAMS